MAQVRAKARRPDRASATIYAVRRVRFPWPGRHSSLSYGHRPLQLCLQRSGVRQPLGYFAFSGGTLAPLFRASESPIAIACFLLFTIPPLPPFPERRVPRFLRRMAARTDLLAAFPYLAICPSHRIVPVALSSQFSKCWHQASMDLFHHEPAQAEA